MKIANSSIQHYGFQEAHSRPRDSDPDINEVVPFGRSGFGLWTAHPIGLVIALGLIVMVSAGIPEAGWFFAGVAILGGLSGLLLWRYQTHQEPRERPSIQGCGFPNQR